ncbi:gamma-crystallin S-1-like [Alosa alosa]|uniref:gamma-crystallin S-1-like n=1 Tax=Alosa alosa TaxID=278164 RepID=UPI0020151565|nr:gamma-crystallin S-1-like [Alosa alosa]
MGKISFFEEKNFGGCYYDCSSDCTDLQSHFRRCNSIKVESGCFMIYEGANYTGHQYFVSPGQYPEFQRWMATNDCICSCRVIPQLNDSFKLSIYERLEFGGQMMDLTDSCPNVLDSFRTNDIFSCKVKEGNWLFYDQPNYKGRIYLLMPREYSRFSEWGGVTARVGSIKRIVEY